MAVKFFSTEYEAGVGAGQVDVKQVTKLNIEATEESPHISIIEREFDNKFDKIPIEVLKMIGGEEGLIEVLASFDNTDRKDFIRNNYIEFDGTMHLKTDYRFATEETEEDIYSFEFNELSIFDDDFIDIECVEVV